MLPSLLSPKEMSDLIDYCRELYGIQDHEWEELRVCKTKDALWVSTLLCYEFAVKQTDDAVESIESMGLRCFSGREFPYKITNAFYQLFQGKITKNILELDAAQTRKMIFPEDIELDEKFTHDKNGYYLCFFKGQFIGIGLKVRSILKSQIPKAFRVQISKKLEFRDE